ncbi:MAG: ribosome-associated translation inhibitor RaiA [Pirellulaceae bacterium]|nr:ribosome-associated translation inhibitor RaiA [Pirellulaceae bacterium]MDP6719542.1 ribosome-associated translation inhibitor RaiA [Pirellulaceae bacterium]MDP7018856.1 ribosome-associated translation inhibitor RaiA [Pirellulaceae bacterium]
MQTNISVRHGNLSQETQDKITEKAEKLRRFFDRLTGINVTVDLEHRDTPRVEVRVSAEHSEGFVAADEAGNVLAALDSVLHKLERQLRKHKEKLTGHRATGLKHLDPGAEIDPEAS